MLVCSRSVGQGANWLTVAGRSIRSAPGKVSLVFSRHRVIRRVQDENGRRDRFPPRGGVPVILLGRLKGSSSGFLTFPLQSTPENPHTSVGKKCTSPSQICVSSHADQKKQTENQQQQGTGAQN